jgi:hypothetical protein
MAGLIDRRYHCQTNMDRGGIPLPDKGMALSERGIEALALARSNTAPSAPST